MVTGMSLFLLEGLTLAFFPAQFKQFLMEADPRWLQIAGLVETLVAAGLLLAILGR
jgi:hypothetical protein